MEFIIVIVISLVFTLVKSLAEKSQDSKTKEPKFQKYAVEKKPQPSEKKRSNTIRPKKDDTVMPVMPTHQKNYSKYQEIEIQVQELEDETGNEIGDSVGGISLDHDEVIKGIIMSEVLQSPRFKKPHRIR